MQTTFLILIATAVVVTTVTNFIKPAYEGLINKRLSKSISIFLALALGVVGAFSVKGYLEIELTTGALFLIGLAIGTGANVRYDIFSLIKSFENKKTEMPDLPKLEKE